MQALSNTDIDGFFSNEKRYLGTYAKDVIPRQLARRNGAMIINMNNSNQGGSHWTLVLLNKRETVYFDSFGVVPSIEVLSFMASRSTRTRQGTFVPKPMYYVDRQLQDLTSSSCGWFCIYFIDECTLRGRDIMDVLLHDFTYDPKENEKLLEKALCVAH